MNCHCQTTLQKNSIRTLSPRPGDIWWKENMRYEDSILCKGRPLLIASVDGDTVTCYKCTSQPSQSEFRYPIMDLMEAGLDRETFVIMKGHTLPKTGLSRRIGHLTHGDMIGVGLRK